MAPLPPDNSWFNAPPLFQIAASQQGGTRGAQVWGLTQDYTLITNWQATPGGQWSGWSPMGGGPIQAGVVQVAAAQQNNGCCQLWVTDKSEQLWSMSQTSPGGDWGGWSGPNWNGAPLLSQLAASQQGGSRGAQLWGITNEDVLISTFQESPGGGWSSWSTTGFLGSGPLLDVAAAQQNDGRVQLWALDLDQRLWSCWQTSPGGDWAGWQGPNWNNAPSLQSIAASQQGGSRGAQLWATDQNNAVWSTYQETPGGNWSGWLGPNWNGAPQFMQMAACQQNNGNVVCLGIDTNLATKAVFQSSPGGDWGGWQP